MVVKDNVRKDLEMSIVLNAKAYLAMTNFMYRTTRKNIETSTFSWSLITEMDSYIHVEVYIIQITICEEPEDKLRVMDLKNCNERSLRRRRRSEGNVRDVFYLPH